MEMIGKGIFDFFTEGEVIYISEGYKPDNLNKYDGKILVVKEATPDIIFYFRHVNGVICETGGVTCHLAMLSLEMGVPCIVGADNILTINEGTYIKVTSKKGVGIVEYEDK